MDCLRPSVAWICGKVIAKDGVTSPNLVFSEKDALAYYSKYGFEAMKRNEVSVPCGKCAACKIAKRKHWSTRLAHEASMYTDACFVTLTYNDSHVPTTDWREVKSPGKQYDRGLGSLPELTLLPSDVQGFIKRLRRHLEYVPKKPGTLSYRGHRIARDHVHVRYFACGEYGSKTHRPHYHILIFGWRPTDLKLLKFVHGRPVYTSAQIENCWTMRDPDGVKRKIGFCSCCDVNPFVAKYVARYVTKKIENVDSDDYVLPEFNLQSVRNGGIGATWFDRFGDSVVNRYVTYRCGDRILKAAVPPYYLARLRKTNQPLWVKLRDERMTFASTHRLTSSAAMARFSELLARVETAKDSCKYFNNKETF